MNERLSAFLADAGLQLRRMDDEHVVMSFDCGRDDAMDKWFCETALKWQREDMCAVWVLSPATNATDPLGFFTLSAHQIIPGNVNKSHKSADASNKSWVNNLGCPFPAQLLGKFALDKSQQGRMLGQMLMVCVYAKHIEAADAAGAKFLVSDVQEDDLVAYYRDQFKFVRSGLVGEMAQMYRPTWVIREELEQALA